MSSDYNEFFSKLKDNCFVPSLMIGERRGRGEGLRNMALECVWGRQGQGRAVWKGCGFSFQFVLSLPLPFWFLFCFCLMF